MCECSGCSTQSWCATDNHRQNQPARALHCARDIDSGAGIVGEMGLAASCDAARSPPERTTAAVACSVARTSSSKRLCCVQQQGTQAGQRQSVRADNAHGGVCDATVEEEEKEEKYEEEEQQEEEEEGRGWLQCRSWLWSAAGEEGVARRDASEFVQSHSVSSRATAVSETPF